MFWAHLSGGSPSEFLYLQRKYLMFFNGKSYFYKHDLKVLKMLQLIFRMFSHTGVSLDH